LVRHEVFTDSKLNTSRLKERLLQNFPDLMSLPRGRDILLSFKDNVGAALMHVKNQSDADAVHLMHSAQIIRNEIFSITCAFNGTFSSTSQRDAVSPSLLTLVSMLLEGTGTLDSNDSQAALSISQLITFNAVKRKRKIVASNSGQGSYVRHPLTQETPLPIYLGLVLHSATCKKKLIDKCFKLGLFITYDRVIQITTKLANNACTQYQVQ